MTVLSDVKISYQQDVDVTDHISIFGIRMPWACNNAQTGLQLHIHCIFRIEHYALYTNVYIYTYTTQHKYLAEYLVEYRVYYIYIYEPAAEKTNETKWRHQ
jgi:hypothetical protein